MEPAMRGSRGSYTGFQGGATFARGGRGDFSGIQRGGHPQQ